MLVPSSGRDYRFCGRLWEKEGSGQVSVLGTDREFRVLQNVSINPRILEFPHIMGLLMKGSLWTARLFLAKNPVVSDFPAEILLALASDDQMPVRRQIAEYPNLTRFPRQVPSVLAKDSSPAVRTALAGNPSIVEFSEIVELLSTDKNRDVRRAIESNSAVQQVGPTRPIVDGTLGNSK